MSTEDIPEIAQPELPALRRCLLPRDGRAGVCRGHVRGCSSTITEPGEVKALWVFSLREGSGKAVRNPAKYCAAARVTG